MKTTAHQLVLFLFLGSLFMACSNKKVEPTQSIQADVTVTIDNVGSTAWEVTDIKGDNTFSALNSENSDWTLKNGLRYRIINNGGSIHPLDLRDSQGNLLLTQDGSKGSFEADTAVNFQSDQEGITFTVSAKLYPELATYHCSVHAPMTGAINPGNNTGGNTGGGNTGGGTAPSDTVRITIDNNGFSAWQVTAVSGATGVATLNQDNVTITLTKGVRYEFTNNGGSNHPLDFRNSAGDKLLTEDTVDGSFETDSNVNFSATSNHVVSFTLTDSLAAEIDSYHCSVHTPMTGKIVVQ